MLRQHNAVNRGLETRALGPPVRLQSNWYTGTAVYWHVVYVWDACCLEKQRGGACDAAAVRHSLLIKTTNRCNIQTCEDHTPTCFHMFTVSS